MSEKKPPLFTVRGTPGSGNQLKVWENEGSDGRIRYNGTLTHSYKDESGQWHETTSINSQDFLDVGEMYREAHAKVKEHARAKAAQQRQEAGQDTAQAAPPSEAAPPAGHVERERKRAGGRQR
jgi:hypothetical protein